MSRPNQQIARLIQELIRGVQSGKIKLRWILGLVVLVVGYFLLQPVLEQSLGVDLPGFDDLTAQSQPTESSTSSRKIPGKLPDPANASPNEDLEKIYRSGRGTYTSPAGLRYTRGSTQGHRLKHLMAHAQDQPDRPGPHGVFDTNDIHEIVALVDIGYAQAEAGRDTQFRREDKRLVFEVNFRRRIGYIGGTSGNRNNHPAAKHMRLVIEGDRLITAFPVRP